jgi:hypothetical protein
MEAGRTRQQGRPVPNQLSNNTMNTQEHLRAMGACQDARQWAAQFDNWHDIINNCQRPDWLLWLDEKMSILDDKERRLLACYFVRSTPLGDGRKVWDLLTDERSRSAVRVAERCANGNATLDEMAAAWDAAGAAAWDAARDAAGDAAWAAARDAAEAAAGAAAWDAAWAAAWAAAREHQAKHILKEYGKRIIAFLSEKHPVT